MSALAGGAVVTLSYGHLLWANAILSWIPVLLVLRPTEPPPSLERGKKKLDELKAMLSTTLVRDTATRLVFLNLVVAGTGGLVMFWVNQGIRASFCLLGPLAGYGIDAWGLPSVLSALGIVFSIAFVFLLLPLVLGRRTVLSFPLAPPPQKN